ncbi:MAG TPA: hypothetical protein VH079_19490 [Terriglobales bacterium]|jgi:hypothetical protein|nr:hypothetical protein [Terriglobales bacterium]
MPRQIMLWVLFSVLASSCASSQVPRPYVYGGLSLNSGGYSPTAGAVGTGLDIDSTHAMASAEIRVDNASKEDSGTGHDIGARVRAFYRTEGGWYVGGGAQWSKLVTSIYSKEAWRPTFGGGKDVVRKDFSIRPQIIYVLPGTDQLNAVQGPEFSIWMPSPKTKSHFFYRQTLGVYEFHQTSVPNNAGTQNRSVASFLEFTVMYRH